MEKLSCFGERTSEQGEEKEGKFQIIIAHFEILVECKVLKSYMR